MTISHTLKINYICVQLINISDDGFLSLMAENGDTRDDLRVPEGPIGEEIRAKFDA